MCGVREYYINNRALFSNNLNETARLFLVTDFSGKQLFL